MNDTRKSVRTIVNMRVELYEWIRNQSFAERVSMSRKINTAVENEMKRMENKKTKKVKE